MTAPSTLDTVDIEGVDFAFEDSPEIHAVLERLRSEKPYAVVPFAGVKAVLLLTHDLIPRPSRTRTPFRRQPSTDDHRPYWERRCSAWPVGSIE